MLHNNLCSMIYKPVEVSSQHTYKIQFGAIKKITKPARKTLR